MTRAKINGKILTWARERAGMDVMELALSMDKQVEDILNWEIEETMPTFRQAQTLAQKLHIPFGYLFLTDPPEESPTIPDLRQVRKSQRNKLSINFYDVLNDALLKQDWYKETLINEGAEPLPFVGKFSIQDNAIKVAEDIRKTLGINDTFRRNCRTWSSFLTNFITACENNGIIILRNGVVQNNTNRKLDINEFRGFVLSDKIAPFIFINNNDSEAAKIFTIAHEIAHLWIGESGVTNEDKGKPSSIPLSEIEKFCNRVAAETLVPKEQFLEYWNEYKEIEDNLLSLSRRFKVSELVLLIRAKELRRITKQDYYIRYGKYSSRRGGKSSGGNAHNTIPARNSKVLTRAVITSALEGNTLFRDAAAMLGLKNINTLDSLAINMGIR